MKTTPVSARCPAPLLLLLLLSLTGAATEPGDEPSAEDIELKAFHHNDTHAMVHINSSASDVHRDILIPHGLLAGSGVELEPKDAAHASPDDGVTAMEAPSGGSAGLSMISTETEPPTQTKPTAEVTAVSTPAAIYERSTQPTEPAIAQTSPAPAKVDSPASSARPSPAADNAGLGTTAAPPAAAAAPETSSSEEDEDEDDEYEEDEDEHVLRSPSGALLNSTVPEDREGEMAAADDKKQWKVTTFTIVLCSLVGSVFVILVGVWVRRIRRYENRRLLQEDDEEFTVFNVIDHQYPARKVEQYSPLP